MGEEHKDMSQASPRRLESEAGEIRSDLQQTIEELGRRGRNLSPKVQLQRYGQWYGLGFGALVLALGGLIFSRMRSRRKQRHAAEMEMESLPYQLRAALTRYLIVPEAMPEQHEHEEPGFRRVGKRAFSKAATSSAGTFAKLAARKAGQRILH